MTTADEIRAGLSSLTDPLSGQALIPAGVLKSVDVQGVDVTLVLDSLLEESRKERIEQGVRQILSKLDSTLSPSFIWFDRPTPTRAPKQKLPGIKSIVAVYACKGGVGKSTISTNLAVAWAAMGYKVGLMDADVHGPNIPLMMGLSERPAVSDDNKITPLEAHGVKVMSLGLLKDVKLPMIWRGPMVHGAIQQLLRDTLWGELDYLVIDLPPGTGDAQLSVAQTVDLTGVVTVTTPQAVSLADGLKGMNMFRKLEVPILGLVENMSGFTCPECHHVTDIFSKGGGRSEAEKWGVPFLGEVPLDAAIVQGGDSGKPLVVSSTGSVAGNALRQIAISVEKSIKKLLEAVPAS